MNKSIKRLFSVLLAVLVVTALSASALADDVPNTDEYTVTMSAGNVEGAYVIGETSWTRKANEPLTLSSVGGLENSPYYFKGVRPAGRDNSVIYSSTIRVTEDADYVAAYGLRGDLVEYTITYRDVNGNNLAVDDEIHYGNIGDKIVVGAREFDGYQPNAYQLTKTLVRNESENVFPFVYSEVIPVTPAPAPTPVILTEGEAAAGEDEAAAGEAAAGEEVPAEEAPAGAAPAEEAPAEEITPEEVPLNNAPQEIIDLDEEDTPLGNMPEKELTPLQQERQDNKTKLFVAVGMAVVALAAVATVAVVALRRRKSAR